MIIKWNLCLFIKWQVSFDFNWGEKLEIFLDTKKSNFLDKTLFLVQTENDKVFWQVWMRYTVCIFVKDF